MYFSALRTGYRMVSPSVCRFFNRLFMGKKTVTEAELAYIRQNASSMSSREMRIALGLQHSWQLRYRARLAGVKLQPALRKNAHLQRKLSQQEKSWLAANYRHVTMHFIQRFLEINWKALYRELNAMGFSKSRPLTKTNQPTNNKQL